MDTIIDTLSGNNITITTFLLGFIIALVTGVIGGAIGGIIVGGKHMGNELAAMMGGFFGPIAAGPGVIIALIVLLFI